MQEAICAAAFIVGDASSRAISESRKVAGTVTAPPADAVSMMALVISSMNSGTPSLRARISLVSRPGSGCRPAVAASNAAAAAPSSRAQRELNQARRRAKARLALETAGYDQQR